jgi:hypothetical protein
MGAWDRERASGATGYLREQRRHPKMLSERLSLDRRTKRRRRRRIGVLVVLIAATALVAAVPAVGQQEEEASQQEDAASQQSVTDTDKKEGDVSTQSFTQKASFTSGSGATFLRVAVSDAGNLLHFESPQGKQSVSREGYALCSGGFSTLHGYDIGSSQTGFGTPTFSQPNGAGTFPLTVTRNTTDGKLQLKQVWAKPDATEKDVTVTMTATNRTSSKISGVVITRFGDIDAGGNDPSTGFNDRGSRTDDSVFQWDDYGDGGEAQISLALTALTFQTGHIPYIEDLDGWNPNHCQVSTPVFGPDSFTTRQDLAMRMQYFVGDIAAGASKTVKYKYGRT